MPEHAPPFGSSEHFNAMIDSLTQRTGFCLDVTLAQGGVAADALHHFLSNQDITGDLRAEANRMLGALEALLDHLNTDADAPSVELDHVECEQFGALISALHYTAFYTPHPPSAPLCVAARTLYARVADRLAVEGS